MASLICKLSYGAEIRRFTLKSEQMTYCDIQQRAAAILGLAGWHFNFQYRDDEGDMITMSSDEEMQEAVSLALSLEPSILRLAVKLDSERTHAKPTESSPVVPAARLETAPEPSAATMPDLSVLLEKIGEQLPGLVPHIAGLVSQLPPTVQAMLNNAEVDTVATAAASLNANTGNCPLFLAGGYGDVNVHPGVSCDSSGMSPIVGNRFHLRGQNYDLCEAEFVKLSPLEQTNYEKIVPPFRNGSKPASANANVDLPHFGVTCDKSGMCPIIGNRYHLNDHDYDLCEVEFVKLSSEEQAKFTKMPPILPGSWRRSVGCPWSQQHMSGGGSGGGGGHYRGGIGPNKLAARFVTDVAIFDGTQMAPLTRFTKIWRLKNVGEVPWPEGSKLLFVSGDRMEAELSVVVSARSVSPGEEIDIAVDMIAPNEIGRYLGYWRLVGPWGRRKFGQRIWCHIQVVDPSTPPQDEFANISAEISTMMNRCSEHGSDDDGDDEPIATLVPTAVQLTVLNADGSVAGTTSHAVLGATAAVPASLTPSAPLSAPPSAPPSAPVRPTFKPMSAAAGAAAARATAARNAVITVTPKAKAPVDASEPKPARLNTVIGVKMWLIKMGFEPEMVETALKKHGANFEACTNSMILLSDWGDKLSELEEMGFKDTSLNKKMLIIHDGSIKHSVKGLVANSSISK